MFELLRPLTDLFRPAESRTSSQVGLPARSPGLDPTETGVGAGCRTAATLPLASSDDCIIGWVQLAAWEKDRHPCYLARLGLVQMLLGSSADSRGFSCKPKNFQRGTPNSALMIIRQDLWWGHAACIDPSPGTWMHEKYRSLLWPLPILFVSCPRQQNYGPRT